MKVNSIIFWGSRRSVKGWWWGEMQPTQPWGMSIKKKKKDFHNQQCKGLVFAKCPSARFVSLTGGEVPHTSAQTLELTLPSSLFLERTLSSSSSSSASSTCRASKSLQWTTLQSYGFSRLPRFSASSSFLLFLLCCCFCCFLTNSSLPTHSTSSPPQPPVTLSGLHYLLSGKGHIWYSAGPFFLKKKEFHNHPAVSAGVNDHCSYNCIQEELLAFFHSMVNKNNLERFFNSSLLLMVSVLWH